MKRKDLRDEQRCTYPPTHPTRCHVLTLNEEIGNICRKNYVLKGQKTRVHPVGMHARVVIRYVQIHVLINKVGQRHQRRGELRYGRDHRVHGSVNHLPQQGKTCHTEREGNSSNSCNARYPALKPNPIKMNISPPKADAETAKFCAVAPGALLL